MIAIDERDMGIFFKIRIEGEWVGCRHREMVFYLSTQGWEKDEAWGERPCCEVLT